MSDSCCADPADDQGAGRCPISGSVGQPVKWTMMAALCAVPIPPRQQVWLCLEAGCEVDAALPEPAWWEHQLRALGREFPQRMLDADRFAAKAQELAAP
jgi:hypothetical protein